MEAKPTGVKNDSGKLNWSLVPWSAMESVVRVLMRGAVRYGIGNWMHVPEARDRYFSAAMRHLLAWQGGEDLDEDDKEPHLSHAICCLLFLSWFDGEPK
jgi:hypothetical protein